MYPAVHSISNVSLDSGDGAPDQLDLPSLVEQLALRSGKEIYAMTASIQSGSNQLLD